MCLFFAGIIYPIVLPEIFLCLRSKSFELGENPRPDTAVPRPSLPAFLYEVFRVIVSVLYWRGLLEFTLSNSNYECLLEKCFVHFMFVDLSNRTKVVK